MSKHARHASLSVTSVLVLPAGCLLALAWANTWAESYYRFSHALEFAVNDIGVVFFFALMTKEVVEATLAGGALHPWRRAALPVAAAAGGLLVPALLFLAFLRYVTEPMLMETWAVTGAVDAAVCYFVGRLIFGRHPAVPFLLLLALASDAVGLAVIASFDPAPAAPIVGGLVVVTLAAGWAVLLRRRGVASFWPYLIGPGVASWFGLYLSGVHPALALVPIVPFMPHAARDAGLFVEAVPPSQDALSRFERWWTPPGHAILFLFGLVNAGVPLHGLEAGMWAVPVATLIGRPVGVVLGAELGIAAGLHRTPRVGWRELVVIGSAASVGLTVALFFATAILGLGSLRMQTKSGALFTVCGVLVAVITAWVLGVGRFRPVHRRGES